jgi:5'-nucleotidase
MAPTRLAWIFASLALAATPLAGCGDDNVPVDGGVRDLTMQPDQAVPPDLAPAARHLIILHTNDEHSHLFAWAPELDDDPMATKPGTGTLIGGIARRAALLKQERDAAAAVGADVLTLSAGDNVMGSLTQVGFTQSAPDFQVMKALGYDATCLGNHEFDYGPKALATALGAAKAAGNLIPTLSTNIHFSATDPGDDTLAAGYSDKPDPNALVEKYHVLTLPSGLKVGLIGIVGADAAYDETTKTPVQFSLGPSMSESNYPEVMTAVYADVQSTVDTLRNTEKVDLVIALDHAGANLGTPSNGEDWQIAENVPGIDVIISGHTHTAVPAPQLPVNKMTNRMVPVVQAGAFGAYVGKLDITLHTDGTVTVDMSNSKLLKVDDTILPDTTFAAQQYKAVHGLESVPWMGGNQSFLEGELSRITGKAVMDDATKDGDLYFYPLGQASFDIPHVSFHETDVLDLSTDAMLIAGDKYLPMGTQNEISVQSPGVIRGSLPKGKTGTLDFADLFRVLALGSSPVDGSIGYPLVHFYIKLVYLKAAFELVAAKGITSDSDYLLPSGLRVSFDTSRPYFNTAGNVFDPANGRVTKIEWNSNHVKNGLDTANGTGFYDTVLFDSTQPQATAWTPAPLTPFGVTTSSYIASFAAGVGVVLYQDPQGLMPLADISTAIIHRPDGSEVKDFEALAEFVWAQTAQNTAQLPARYNPADPAGAVPRRVFCMGMACPP